MDWIAGNWWWLILLVPAVLLGLRQVVKTTKPEWDDKLFLPIIDGLMGVFDLMRGRRGK